MLKSFLKLVEIQTKVASMVPFFLGTVYVLYQYQKFNFKIFLLMAISLLAFDMATTAVNNYFDYKKAYKKEGFNYENHNAIVKYNLTETTVIFIIFALLLTAILAGISLYLNTNTVILALGAISFLVGILYSFGPIPISRMPLGELFSGFFMGFVIVFISIYIHVYNQGLLSLMINKSIWTIHINIIEVFYIFLVSIPAVTGIANIMLANNICDIEDDIENQRYTLPIYIGKENSLKLFKSLYYIVYLNLVVLVVLKIIPLISLLVFITFIPVKKNIDLFNKKQTKKETFVLSVRNFLIINVVYILTIVISIIFG